MCGGWNHFYGRMFQNTDLIYRRGLPKQFGGGFDWGASSAARFGRRLVGVFFTPERHRFPVSTEADVDVQVKDGGCHNLSAYYTLLRANIAPR